MSALSVRRAVVLGVAVVEVTVAGSLSETGAVVVTVGERRGEGAGSRRKHGSEGSEEGSFHENDCAEAIDKQFFATAKRRLLLLEPTYANPRPKMARTQKLRAYARQIPTNRPNFQT